jgi:hypothetical protein
VPNDDDDDGGDGGGDDDDDNDDDDDITLCIYFLDVLHNCYTSFPHFNSSSTHVLQCNLTYTQ